MNQRSVTAVEMQAIAQRRFGGLDTLELMTLPVPEVGAGEVLIRVQAAGVGEWDAFEREGGYARMLGIAARFPYVLGSEGAGEVVAVGDGVQRFAIGEQVYAAAFLNPKGGFYAQYAAVPESLVSRIPHGLSLETAAVMAGVGITAMRGLEDTLRLEPGEALLIAGASGGVGHMAVQLAKRAGARVFAVASRSDGVALARDLGADVAVDGRAGTFVPELREFAPRGFDAALLVAYAESIAQGLHELRAGGRVAYPSGVQPPALPTNARCERYDGNADAEILARFERAVTSGSIRVHIAQTFALAEARAAQSALQQHHLGKIALRVA